MPAWKNVQPLAELRGMAGVAANRRRRISGYDGTVRCSLGRVTFFGCNFSARISNYLQIDWSFHDDMHSAIVEAKRDFGQPFFMEVVITACWHIWKLRNERIFQNERPRFARWRSNFIHDLELLGHRIKRKYHARFMLWVANLP